SFALLVTHGTAVTVLVTVACMVAADAIRRPALVKVVYNAAQYAVSWALAGVVYRAFAGSPAALSDVGLAEFAALVPAGLAYALVNSALAQLPPALLRGAPVLAEMRRELGFVLGTTILLLALAPIVVVVGARDPWLVPLLGVLLIGIQLGSRAALLNEAHARVDPLTGAYSRQELERILARRLAGPGDAAVVVVDLAGFADVNDALGHHAGDSVLRAVAQRLVKAAGHGELVARTGGDAFAIVCDAGRAEAVVGGLEAALEPPIAVGGLEIDVRAVAGIACAPAESAGALLREADVALRAAKARRVRWVRFDPAMSVDAADRLALAPELRRAIGADELVLHYQPKLDLRTGRLAGVEALVRWDRPGHGLMPPDAFIGLAEHTGLIRPLTSWVLQAAAAEQARWARDGLLVTVAVNLSARALHMGVVEEVAGLLARGADLELEVTESAAMHDPEDSLAVLERLAALGVRLSVDDFGTGHSSLAYVARLPVVELKIDRTFVVAGLDGETANRSIVATTIELGRRLGLRVVAEGVEDDATLASLRALGCDHAQGYGIARPMPAAAVPGWVAALGQSAGTISRSSTSKNSA
ncbi:MAG TPA: bifunctional diguanylate cyclase/phosphodiesterase, partial [Solirubrobacteraceae bacterium]|nr:bifunctional diguanylate cyclase/phosphodiesterase [Solirubrobacteraceae bacterium]